MIFKGVILLVATYVCVTSALPPCTCTRNFKPVCGTDGNTYSNECALVCEQFTSKKDLTVAKEGPCETDPKDCICTLDYRPVCGSDGKTYPNRCSLRCQRSVDVSHDGACKQTRAAQPPCVCTREMKPVCGSDGNTYANPCMLNCATIENSRLSIEHTGQCSNEVKVVDQPDSKANVPTCACTRNIRPVCGTDGVTYNNECLLRCSGNDVSLAKNEPCEA